MAGAWITVFGAIITIVMNYVFIPRFSYVASAWATFCCYGSMMLLSYAWGQKEFPIPYATKKLIAYIVLVVLIYFVHRGLTHLWSNSIYSLGLATIFFLAFIFFIFRVEKKEFKKLPIVGRFAN